MVQPEDIYEPEWVAWFQMTPEQRWSESSKLWQFYLAAGGSLDPEPDPQSPFFFSEDSRVNTRDRSEKGHLDELVRIAWRERMRTL